jgi:hypothetical protein
MFGKRKKRDHSTLDFKTPNYGMSDSYKTENLVVAKLQYVSSKYTDFGPMVETTKQRYIFEKIEEDDQLRYREVFTGFVAKTSEEFFDLPYVVDIKPLQEAVPSVAEEVPKYGLLLLIDEVNKQKVKVKVTKRQGK